MKIITKLQLFVIWLSYSVMVAVFGNHIDNSPSTSCTSIISVGVMFIGLWLVSNKAETFKYDNVCNVCGRHVKVMAEKGTKE